MSKESGWPASKWSPFQKDKIQLIKGLGFHSDPQKPLHPNQRNSSRSPDSSNLQSSSKCEGILEVIFNLKAESGDYLLRLLWTPHWLPAALLKLVIVSSLSPMGSLQSTSLWSPLECLCLWLELNTCFVMSSSNDRKYNFHQWVGEVH